MPADADNSGFALVASGQSGPFTVEVLRRGDDRLMLSIESSEWCFTFDLAGADSVAAANAFLRAHLGRAEFAELEIGRAGDLTVRLLKDDEFADRLFLRAFGNGSLVDFTLTTPASADLAAAVAAAAADLT